jgi:hypothetical protein
MELTSHSLEAYLAVIRPIVDRGRSELNVILKGVIESTVSVLNGEPAEHTRLIADSWLAWLMFNEQMARYGSVTWSKHDREFVRVLNRCASVLHDAAGEDATKHLSIAGFETLFTAAYPALSSTIRKRLAHDVAHRLNTLGLTIADTERQIAKTEAAKPRKLIESSCCPVASRLAHRMAPRGQERRTRRGMATSIATAYSSVPASRTSH